MLLLHFLTNMTNNLQQFSEIQSQLFPEDMLSSLLEGMTVKSDEERIRETKGMKSYYFLNFLHFPRFCGFDFIYRRCYTLIFFNYENLHSK